jgi:hypothetical protein
VYPQKFGRYAGSLELRKSGTHSFHTREDASRTVAYITASKVTVVIKMSALVLVQIQISPEFIHYSARNKMSICTAKCSPRLRASPSLLDYSTE